MEASLIRRGGAAIAGIVIVGILCLTLILPKSAPPDFLFVSQIALAAGNTLFISLASFAVAATAARIFLINGIVNSLLFGCGALAFGLSSFLTGLVVGGEDGANLGITIYNCGAFLGGLFHFSGALSTLAGAPVVAESRRGVSAVLAGAAILVLVLVPYILVRNGILPAFFISGQGPTMFRQIVLSCAVALYCLSSIFFLRIYLRTRSSFLFWYAMGLLLIGSGLAALFLLRSIYGPIGWTGKIAQYLGGIYFLFAVLSALKEARRKKEPVEATITRLLKRSDELYTSLVETVNDAIISFDQNKRILLWNRAAEEMFGHCRSDAVGLKISDLIGTGRSAVTLNKEINKLWNKNRELSGRRIADLTMMKKNGELFPAEISLSGKKTDKQRIGTMVARDITERKQAEKSFRRYSKRLESLVRLSTDFLSERSMEKFLQRISDAARELTGARIGASAYGYLDGAFRFGAASGAAGSPLSSKGGMLSVPRGGVYLHLIQKARSLRLKPDELVCHPLWWGLPEGHPPLRGLLGASLFDENGRACGLIMVSDKNRGGFSAEDEAVLMQLAALASLSLQHIEAKDELEVRVQERTAELAASNQKLERRSRQLACLSSELTLAEQRERRRMATVIHDHLQQLLVAAKINLEILSHQMKDDRRQTIRSIDDLLTESLRTSRSLTAELSPPILYDRGLGAGLEWLARWMREKYELDVQLQIDPRTVPNHENITVLLFQSVRELLFNVVKHARVTSARVTLSADDAERLKIVVSDQGTGFDCDQVWKDTDKASGFGLFTIKERLELLGGRLEIRSMPGQGSAFTLVAPLVTSEWPEGEDRKAELDQRQLNLDLRF